MSAPDEKLNTQAPTKFLSTTEKIVSPGASPGILCRLARVALYAFVVLIACPIRYWPLGSGEDATWRYALNYAAAQGSAVASQIVFTMGPLNYLLFPENIGKNLAHGLFFQFGLWLVLATIFADFFFRADFSLRNLALFSFFFALATPLFWFASMGTEDLIFSGALILIVVFQLRGSLVRYLIALALVGLLPMFKLSAAVIGAATLGGLVIEMLIQRGTKAFSLVAITATVPLGVAAVISCCVMPSPRSVLNYLHGSAEIIGGYSSAMAVAGPKLALISAAEAVAVIVVLLGLQAFSAPKIARFYVLLLSVPIFLSFKHGFVRQDTHVINFFCFIALALALVSLTVRLDKAGLSRVLPLAVLFFIIWQDNIYLGSLSNLVVYSSGEKAAGMLWGAMRFDNLKHRLDSSIETYSEDSRIEPELVNLIGDSPVASLSSDFTNVAAAHLQLKLYPVVQRYSAYTPYLDGLNAAWIRNQGPRFLIFDGKAFYERDPWAETPAMFMEIYRWYDARLLGRRNLLLERRATPRFAALETVSRFRMAFPGELRLPVSNDVVFWTMKCDFSTKGKLANLMFRIPSVLISVHEADGSTRSAHIIPKVLVSPVLGNYLPGDLSQFYEIFSPKLPRDYSVDQIVFKPPQSWAYASTCEVETLGPARIPGASDDEERGKAPGS